MPVRQALHSFIASSCGKPPASKEEAQAVLEEMFRLRAEKVRRAIEQGKLATTEALRLRVCQRRESVGMSEGSHRNAAASPTSPTPDADQKKSGYRQEKQVVSSLVAEPEMEVRQDPGSRGALHYNQAATWGLSDDEIMSSFTTFTAKLSDTLLARDGTTNIAERNSNTNTNINTNSNTDVGFIKPEATIKTQTVPVLSPTMGHSPTTSAESDSPSPWTPWMSLNNNNSNNNNNSSNSNNTHDPTNNVDVTQQNNRPGIQESQLFAQTSVFPAFPQDLVLPTNSDSQMLLKQQQQQQPQQPQQPQPQQQALLHSQPQQTQAWNQYMQYLLHQQGQEGSIGLQIQQQQLLYGQVRFAQPTNLNPNPNLNPNSNPNPNLSPPFPSQASGAGQGVDPHWQATMMAMMMEDPTLESFGGLSGRLSGGLNGGLNARLNGGPGLGDEGIWTPWTAAPNESHRIHQPLL
ncbi:hypothetical protein BGZ81_003294 [Podila clonocystis]|nr:hypothetical protein BGZ81_003294 [Podila clonocystis]